MLRQRCIDREEYTILNNILAKSLGSGRGDEEEDDDVEDDSVEDDKTEGEDKSPDERINGQSPRGGKVRIFASIRVLS